MDALTLAVLAQAEPHRLLVYEYLDWSGNYLWQQQLHAACASQWAAEYLHPFEDFLCRWTLTDRTDLSPCYPLCPLHEEKSP